MNEVIIAAITGATTLIVAVIGFAQAVRIKSLEKEILKKGSAIGDASKNFSAYVLLSEYWSIARIKSRVELVFSTTKVDRFLILIAVNGKEDFNVVSVIYQDFASGPVVDAISRYKHILIDDEYKKMVKSAERNPDGVLLDVEIMPKCLLKNIYKNEKVTNSVIKHIDRVKLDADNDMIVFCSMATRNGAFTEEELGYMHAGLGEIKHEFKNQKTELIKSLDN